MSYTIKLEDVPEKIAKDFDWTPRSQIAAIINAAIEAGMVSPPCHVLTRSGGYVIDLGYDGAIRVWPGKAYGPNVEHYRGQKA